MLAAFTIMLRETLEATLIVGILLAYLDRTKNKKHNKYIWRGVFGGIILSFILAFIFQNYLGGFEGTNEQIYEGITLLVAAGLITWMILWMLGQRGSMRKHIESKAEIHVQKDYPLGLFFLSFVGIFREGVETVIFLQAAILQTQNNANVLIGSIGGLVSAIVLSYIIFKGFHKLPLRKFFTTTSILFILFAAGLLAHGIHEFQEAGLLPVYIEHLWDMNNVINENGTLGSLLKGLFGYNGNPSLLEVISYTAYLGLIALIWRQLATQKE